MATTNGTYSILDLLQVKNASAAEFGIDIVARTIQSETDYLNSRVNEMLSDLCQPTSAQIQTWGGGLATSFPEVDEFGVGYPEKQSLGINASVPLKRYAKQLGWSVKYMELKTPAELAEEYLAVRKGYLNRLTNELKRAIFSNVTYTWVDKLYNNVSLTVYPFINADSTTLPNSPAGVTFDGSTHDHYDGEASFTPGFINSLITDVTEHGHTKGLQLICALADASNFTSASAGFTSLPDSSTQTLLTQLVSGETVDNSDLENRQIGYWTGGIPVFIRPWAVANYVVCVSTNGVNGAKPLLYRQRPQSNLQGFRLNGQIPNYPLIVDYAEAEFGFAAFDRTQLGVLYFANATYAVPTIA